MEQLDRPIPPSLDAPWAIRRLVAEYGDQIGESATASSSTIKKSLDEAMKSTLALATTVQNVLLEQIDHLGLNGCLSINPISRQHGLPGRLQLSAECVDILSRLSNHVRALASSPGEKLVLLDRAREIYLIVELILSHLLDPAKDNANISGVLSEFNRSALGYVLDQYVDPSLVLYGDEPPNLNPTLGLCPLEEAFGNFLSTPNGSKHSLIAFTTWAQMEPMDSEISQNIGPVTSVSLYWVSKGLIRHEFAIIALGGGKVPTSWLRAERMARVSSGRFSSDGLSPPFSGASAFDLVSFSSSKSALVGNDVIRVAEVSIAMGPAVLRMGMYVSELAESLVLLFGHHPKYPLLASNCRYFSRRMVLDFAERHAKIPSLRTRLFIKLLHKEGVSYRKLADKLQDEPLHGSLLVGERGVLNEAEIMFGQAQRHLILSRNVHALQLCEEAVEMLESIPKNKIPNQVLMGRCYILKCEIYRKLHRLDDSYAAGRLACDVLRTDTYDDLASRASEVDCLARALEQCSRPALELGFKEDALRYSTESVTIRRLLLGFEPQSPYHLFHLGFSLTCLSLALSEMGEMATAVETGQESVQILRTLHLQQPDIFGDGLAATLHNHALVLAQAKRTEQAHTTAAEVVELRREVNLIPERRLHLLALALHSYSVHVAAIERWEDSISADKESLEYYKSLQVFQPLMFETEAIHGWESYSRHLKRANRPEEALACRREHLQAVRHLFDRGPTLHRADLAVALYHSAHYAWGCKHLEESTHLAQESLEHYQILAGEDPKYEFDVAKGFSILCNYLSHSGLVEESVRHRQQQIVVIRGAFAKDPDPWRKNLADALYNLGSDLAQLNRWIEAVEVEEEVLQLYGALAVVDPNKFNSDVADTHGSLSVHLPLTGNSRGVDHGRRQIEILRSLAIVSPDLYQENLARALSQHSAYLNAAKLWGETMAAASESLELYRHLAGTKPEEYNSRVIFSLDLLAAHLSDAEQFQEALGTRKELVTMLRSAASRDPETYEPYLAYALSRLADDSHNVKHWDQAIEAENESLVIYRSLAKEDMAKYESDVAHGLRSLADHLSSSDRHEEAFPIHKEYVSILRAPASHTRESQKEVLASSLGELASTAAEAKLWDEAIEAAKESLTMYRSLAEDDKLGKYASNIAHGLHSLAKYFSRAEQSEEAYEIQKEYIAFLRAAVTKDPKKHQPSLSKALYDAGEIAAELELWGEACEADNEALQIFRDLEKLDPEEYTEALMESLQNYASHLQSAERLEEAMVYYREQLGVSRTLFAKDPNSNRPKLARALYDNAFGAEDLELWDESIAANKESLELYRILAEENPEEFMTDVVHGLDILSRHLESVGRRDEALIYRREQVSNIRVSLANEADSYWNPSTLAVALLHVGLDSEDSQLMDEAIKADQEALTIYQKLAEDDFETYCSEIIKGLCSISMHFFGLQRLSECATSGKEALVLSSKISGATPSDDRQIVVDVFEDFALFLTRNNFQAQAKEFESRAEEIDGYETEDSDSDGDSGGDGGSDSDSVSDTDSDSGGTGSGSGSGSDSDSGDEQGGEGASSTG